VCLQVPNILAVCSFSGPHLHLRSLYLIVMVHKNRQVIHKASQEPLIFTGLMMLHGDGKYATYCHFFRYLCFIKWINEVVSNGLVVDSDEEQAIVTAAKAAFPNSNHLFCMLHYIDNARHYLSSTGTPTNVREQILTRLFGRYGVTESADEDTMDNCTADIQCTFARMPQMQSLMFKTVSYPRLSATIDSSGKNLGLDNINEVIIIQSPPIIC